MQKAYKSAFLVRFDVSLILAHLPLEEFLGCMVTVEMQRMQPNSYIGFLQEDPQKGEASQLHLSKLEASLEVCNVSRTQQACN